MLKINLTKSKYLSSGAHFINIEAKSDSIFEDPKIYLDSNLGLPIVQSQYIYSLDRKNIEVGFIYNKSLFKEDKFSIK